MNFPQIMASTSEENGDEGNSSTPEYRDRLRTWLIKMIDNGTIPGLHWENEEKTIFRMPWKHAGRQDYSLEEDSRIFMAWAIHSGRYREGIDKPEPIIWKTRLRCALNKMPDIKEIQERSRLDISEPYRVYQFLPPIHKDTQIRRRNQRRSSQVQSPTNIGRNSRESSTTSPTYDRHDVTKNEFIELAANRPSYFPNALFQDVTSGARRHVSHADFALKSGVENRSMFPWITTPGLLPNIDRRLLHGINLQQNLTSPINSGSFVNPFGIFSHGQRDFRQRPDYEIPVYPYPITGTHNPILSQPSIPHLMPTSTSGNLYAQSNPMMSSSLLDFTRHLSLAAQQRHHQQLNRNILEDNEQLRHEDKRLHQDLERLEEKQKIDEEKLRNNPEELEKLAKQLENEMNAVQSMMRALAEKTGNEGVIQKKSYFQKNAESKYRIEMLERELFACREAHERDIRKRKALEAEQEKLKTTLERMGGDLLSLVMSNSGGSDKIKMIQNGEKMSTSSCVSQNDVTSSTSSFRRHSADDMRKNGKSSDLETCKSEENFSSDYKARPKKYLRRVESHQYAASCPELSPFISPRLSGRRLWESNRQGMLSRNASPSLGGNKRTLMAGEQESQRGFPLDLTSQPSTKRFKDDNILMKYGPSQEIKLSTESKGGEGPSKDCSVLRVGVSIESNSVSDTDKDETNLIVPLRPSSEIPEDSSPVNERSSSSSSYPASSNQPHAQSPSTPSSCSSTEDSHRLSSSSSPTSRISPAIPLFGTESSNSYPRYQSRINGPIQVT